MESDSALVRAVQAGDLEAYSELFRRHYPDVQRACARRLACPLEAEEIAQAAFVRALERIEQCRGDRQFGGWVQIIARHLCVDAVRARSRVVPSESPMSEHHSDGNEPHDSLFDRERTMQVRRALDSLPPRQRQAVEARAQGTGPSEIADDLGLSVGAVDSLILRGRRRLAVAYHRVAGEGGSTRTATNASAATVAASILAAVSLGSARLLGGVAAAAEAGRELVAPVAAGAAGAVMSVVVALTGSGPAAPEPANVPSARPPAVVVSVPAPDPAPIAGLPVATPAPTTPAQGLPDPAATVGAVPAAVASATAAPTTTVPPAPGPAAVPAGPVGPPVDSAATPIGQPLPDVVDATVPVVTDVVDAVGDAADGAVGVLDGLLPK